MGKRDDLIEKYAADMKEKCGVTADMDFLRKVTIGCGPAIYNRDASTVSASDQAELDTCLLYTSPSPRDKRQSRMPSSA